MAQRQRSPGAAPRRSAGTRAPSRSSAVAAIAPGSDRPIGAHGCGVEQVDASDDRRYPLVGVVDNDRQVVRREIVTPPNHIVARSLGERRLERTLEPVDETNDALIGDPDSHGCRLIVRRPRSTSAGVGAGGPVAVGA